MKTLYIGYHNFMPGFDDGSWVIGEKVSDNFIDFPRLEVCPQVRRVIAYARKHFPECRLIMSDIALEVAKLETWRFEGWENPKAMFSWVEQQSPYG